VGAITSVSVLTRAHVPLARTLGALLVFTLLLRAFLTVMYPVVDEAPEANASQIPHRLQCARGGPTTFDGETLPH